MTALEWLDQNFNIGISDIETIAATVGVDIVDGIQFLENVLAPIAKDLQYAGDIIEVLDPPLAQLVIAITQVLGIVTASAGLTKNLIANLNNPATVASDYTALQAEVQKFQIIEAAQVSAIQKALVQVLNLAIQAKTSTVQAIENDLKSL